MIKRTDKKMSLMGRIVKKRKEKKRSGYVRNCEEVNEVINATKRVEWEDIERKRANESKNPVSHRKVGGERWTKLDSIFFFQAKDGIRD